MYFLTFSLLPLCLYLSFPSARRGSDPPCYPFLISLLLSSSLSLFSLHPFLHPSSVTELLLHLLPILTPPSILPEDLTSFSFTPPFPCCSLCLCSSSPSFNYPLRTASGSLTGSVATSEAVLVVDQVSTQLSTCREQLLMAKKKLSSLKIPKTNKKRSDHSVGAVGTTYSTIRNLKDSLQNYSLKLSIYLIHLLN